MTPNTTPPTHPLNRARNTTVGTTLDTSLAELAATLLNPHRHTPHTALAALAAAGRDLPAALIDGYTIPDVTPGGQPYTQTDPTERTAR